MIIVVEASHMGLHDRMTIGWVSLVETKAQMVTPICDTLTEVSMPLPYRGASFLRLRSKWWYTEMMPQKG